MVKENYRRTPPDRDCFTAVEQTVEAPEEEEVPGLCRCTCFSSRGGIPARRSRPQSLRMTSEQKYKEGDGPFLQLGGHLTGTSCWCSPTSSSAIRRRLTEFDDLQGQRAGRLPAHQAGHG